jgi:acetyltransferase-like isoleucine patch superfamily enzyme
MKLKVAAEKSFDLKEQKSILRRAFLDLKKGVFWERLFSYLSRFRNFHYGLVTTNRRGKIEVGAASYSSSIIKIAGAGFIKIGKFTSIGSNLSIITGGGHNPKLISTYPFFFKLTNPEGGQGITNLH